MSEYGSSFSDFGASDNSQSRSGESGYLIEIARSVLESSPTLSLGSERIEGCWNKLNTGVRKTLVGANDVATGNLITTEDLFLGLYNGGAAPFNENAARDLLETHSLNLERVRDLFGRSETHNPEPSDVKGLNAASVAVFDQAIRFSGETNQVLVGRMHLLLALIQPNSGKAIESLRGMDGGITVQGIREDVLKNIQSAGNTIKKSFRLSQHVPVELSPRRSTIVKFP